MHYLCFIHSASQQICVEHACMLDNRRYGKKQPKVLPKKAYILVKRQTQGVSIEGKTGRWIQAQPQTISIEIKLKDRQRVQDESCECHVQQRLKGSERMQRHQRKERSGQKEQPMKISREITAIRSTIIGHCDCKEQEGGWQEVRSYS